MVQTEDLEVYLVGGAVRDNNPQDNDFVVVGTSEEELQKRGFSERVGSSVPVFLHPETKDEWSIAQSSDGTVAETIEDDLARRDLTINAMAKNVSTGELIDPFGGKEDLENGVLRHVSDQFTNQPFHILRVALFAGRYPEFTIAKDTKQVCRTMSSMVTSVHNQRLGQILSKNFQLSSDPRRFFDVLDELDSLQHVFPTLSKLQTIPAGPPEYHQEGSVYEHTMRVLMEAKKMRPNDEYVLWAALGHDLGKLHTDLSDLPNHPKHTKIGPTVAEDFANRLQIGHPRKHIMKAAARHHMRFWNTPELREATLLDTANQLGESEFTLETFITLGIADGKGRIPSSVRVDVDTVRRHLQAALEVQDEITGEDILEQFDVDPTNGEKIYNLRLQERVRQLKKKRKQL